MWKFWIWLRITVAGLIAIYCAVDLVHSLWIVATYPQAICVPLGGLWFAYCLFRFPDKPVEVPTFAVRVSDEQPVKV